MLLVDLGAGDEVGDLLLLDHLPVDELLDIGMVGVEDHHLGGAARGAARLDGARGAVADLEEAHQAGRLAAAGQLFAFAAQLGEIRAGAGAVFEQARLAHPQIHDAALVDEVVGDRLDEAGVRLRMLVGGGRLHELAGLVVDVEMALARAVDAVGPVQAGVEPLRRVRRHHLHRQHVAVLVEERLRVGFGGEIAALPAPIGPGAGEPVEHLLAGCFADEALGLRQLGRAPSRRRRCATARTGRSPPRPSSGARARRLCGNISAPARRRRLATIAPALRRSRHGRRPSRPDCGFRSWSDGTRCPRRAIVPLWCSAARSAFSAPFNLGVSAIRRCVPHSI